MSIEVVHAIRMRKLQCSVRETERLCEDRTGRKVPAQILEHEGFVCVLSVLRAEELVLKFDVCVERLRPTNIVV